MKLEGRRSTYLVGAALGAGGMATVHRAVRLGARVEGEPSAVAIKRLHAHVASDPSAVTRFRNEAAISRRLVHPNIVRTLEVVEVEGRPAPALVMELCDGGSLLQLAFATWNRGESVPPAVASAVVIDLSAALGAAHGAKDDAGVPDPIVHRDVSPHNVLVGRDGVAKLTDFGIARLRDFTTSSGAGNLKGKISYMAPELFAGKPASVASDVYAAGVVLWELLASERLFEGEVAEILGRMLAQRREELDLVTRGVPAEAAAVVARAIAVEPERRYESAEVMAAALRNALPPASRVEVGAWVERASLALPGEDEAVAPPSSATQIVRTSTLGARLRARPGRIAIGAGAAAVVLGAGVAVMVASSNVSRDGNPDASVPVAASSPATESTSSATLAPSVLLASPRSGAPVATVVPAPSTVAMTAAPASSATAASSAERARDDEIARAISVATAARGMAFGRCPASNPGGAFAVTYLPTGEVSIVPILNTPRDACILDHMASELRGKLKPSDGKPLTVNQGISGPLVPR